MKEIPERYQNPWFRDDDDSFLEIYDLETDTRTVLKEYHRVIEAPNWSVDGKSLYYNSEGKIWRYDLASGAEEIVPTSYADGCNNDHVLSADGTMLAVSHNTREDHESRVYTLPIGGGTPHLITPMAPSFLHGWSPDGKTLVYCARRGSEYDVYSIPVEGGVETRLTDAEGLNDGPEFDPTGEYIWFNSVRSGLMQAWRMRADGSEQTQMTFDEDWNTWFPHISPDGKKVAMIAYSKNDVKPNEHVPHKHVELRLMDADGSNVRTVAKLFGGQGTINVNSWSPDSKKFAFVSYRIRGIGEL